MAIDLHMAVMYRLAKQGRKNHGTSSHHCAVGIAVGSDLVNPNIIAIEQRECIGLRIENGIQESCSSEGFGLR